MCKTKEIIYDAIIIGAGVSGLAAAKTLIEAGKQILVLEARNRIGGRIYTDRSFGIPIDLGASWAHDLKHNNLVSNRALNFQLLPYHDILKALETDVCYDASGKKLTAAFCKQLGQFITDFLNFLSAQNPEKKIQHYCWHTLPILLYRTKRGYWRSVG